MRTITVEPELLESCAARMDQENQDYLHCITRLYDAVDTMKAAWQGKDNTAFSNQIYRFQADFRQISVLCTQYSEFLRSCARAYREMQEDLAAQASSLN